MKKALFILLFITLIFNFSCTKEKAKEKSFGEDTVKSIGFWLKSSFPELRIEESSTKGEMAESYSERYHMGLIHLGSAIYQHEYENKKLALPEIRNINLIINCRETGINCTDWQKIYPFVNALLSALDFHVLPYKEKADMVSSFIASEAQKCLKGQTISCEFTKLNIGKWATKPDQPGDYVMNIQVMKNCQSPKVCKGIDWVKLILYKYDEYTKLPDALK